MAIDSDRSVGAPDDIVAPSRDDKIVALASGAIGGPAGWRIRAGVSWWTPMRLALILGILVASLGIMQRSYCRSADWTNPSAEAYAHMCYSDIPHLYRLRGLAQHKIPYIDKGDYEQLEYPVLTGGIMTATAAIVWLVGDGNINHEAGIFYDLNAWLMVIFAAVAIWATVKTAGRRPWDAMMFAIAPVLALSGTINWDLAAVALMSLGILAWSRRRIGLAGVMWGLATAAKFYPLLVIGPLFVLCFRARKLKEFAVAVAWGALFWAIVNVPVMLANFQAWAHFYSFSRTRGADYGTLWLVGAQEGWNLTPHTLNVLAGGSLAILCAGIAFIGLRARIRPRFAQLVFLVVAAFLLTNKVYSPQYALWLLPLAVLARPRWRDFLIWQTCEVIYYAGVWLYLLDTSSSDHRGLNQAGYHWAIWIHVLGTAYFAVMVVRDILLPEYDPVRADGSDDPSGGVLDRAPDRTARAYATTT